jgi:hypothetical protein
MKQAAINSQEINAGDVPKVYFDDVTQDKIHKHLSDINDVITEQDIKNIKTDMSILPLSMQQEFIKRKEAF